MKAKETTQILKAARDERGFTLTEMLIVIALIAMVGTFVASNVIGRFNRAKVDATKVQMRNMKNILNQFRLDCGFYPLTDQGLQALIDKPAGGRECKSYDPAGYIEGKKIPKDGFGHEFEYESDGNTLKLISRGNDGQAGGTGNDADISSDEID